MGVIWVDDIIPSPELDFDARDRRPESEVAIATFCVGSEELIEHFVPSFFVKCFEQNITGVCARGRRTITDRNSDGSAVFQGRSQFRINDWRLFRDVGVHSPWAEWIKFFRPSPGEESTG